MALEAVQAQAGHASIETTRIYLHLADSWLADQYRRGAEAIDAQMLADHPGCRSAGERPAAAVLGHPGRRVADDDRHDAPLPRPDRLRAAPGQRRLGRRGAAPVRRLHRPSSPGGHRGGRAGAGPPRGLQAVAGRTPQRPPGVGERRYRAHRLGCCGCSSCAPSNGAGRTRRGARCCSPATCPDATSRCPRRSTTPTPRSSCTPPSPSRARWPGLGGLGGGPTDDDRT
jgi:hypothetical protein